LRGAGGVGGDRLRSFCVAIVGVWREVRVGGASEKNGDEEEAAPFEGEGEALCVEGAGWDVERVHGENDSMGRKPETF